MDEIKVNGNFAVKVGNMWAKQEYSSVQLTKQPDCLMDFKRAYELAKEIGGKVWMFKPSEITDSEMENLVMASGLNNEED